VYTNGKEPVPDHPTWLERIPKILETLKSQTAPPFLDRSAIEGLFGVRRRRAITLLHHFDGYQVGRTFIVRREAVIAFLEKQEPGIPIAEKETQKQRVADFLGEARQALTIPRITLPPAVRLSEITFAGLPPGIQLAPGQLSVSFESATDLVEKLFSLSQALVNDFETLETLLTTPSVLSGNSHASA
jgi:hypothetical protein